jgi:hypothetical protein
VIAAIFEATMERAQVERLAALMREGRPTRPEAVVTAALLVDGDRVQLVALWRDRDSFDRYRATAPVLRGTELMRKVGVEPELRIAEVPEFG